MHYTTSPLIWLFFILFVLGMLALDLGVFHRRSHVISFKESIFWSFGWISLSMIFAGVIYLWHGSEAAMKFLTGYAIEKSLSLDNLFVILLIFNYFHIPGKLQYKVLYYGILGALIMRAFFIWAGIALIQEFHWVTYVFGAFLIYSSVRMVIPQKHHRELGESWLMRGLKHLVPTTSDFHGEQFVVRIQGGLAITPLFISLIFVEMADIIFAIDSIPAIIGISHDPFLVFTSNVFAILGLRALYFSLKGLADLFLYLKYGLSFILLFIGLKMLIAHYVTVPVSVTLIVIFTSLFLSVLASYWKVYFVQSR